MTPDELRKVIGSLWGDIEQADGFGAEFDALYAAADAWEAQLASLPGGSPAGAWEIMRQLRVANKRLEEAEQRQLEAWTLAHELVAALAKEEK